MASEAYASLQSDLATLLIRAGADAARRLQVLGFPLVFAEQQTLVARDDKDPNAWRSSEIIVNRGALAPESGVPLFRVAPLLSDDTASAARGCAARIARLPESRLPFFSPFGSGGDLLIADTRDSDNPPPSFDDEPEDWVLRHLVLPALYGYLGRILRLRRVGASAASAFAREVLDVATASDMKYLVTVPLAGIRVNTRFAVTNSDAVFRPLSQGEQGELLAGWGLMTGNITTLPMAALELTVATERNTHNPDPREALSRWLCAFLLHGYEISSHRAKLRANPSWLLPFGMDSPVPSPLQTYSWSTLTPSKAANLMATADRLMRYSVSDPQSERDLALHRFSSGAARASHVDGILDFVIALEALLLPYDEDARRGDLTYRFRMHGAHYLSNTKSGRSLIAKQLTDLYYLRSRLVHGGKYPDSVEIESGWNSARNFARIGLCRAVAEGFPSAAKFKAMLLGA